MNPCPVCGKKSLTTMGGTPHCRSCKAEFIWSDARIWQKRETDAPDKVRGQLSIEAFCR